MKSTYDTTAILEQLDQATKNFHFPVLDNGYVYLADVRLTAFASRSKWVLIIETLGFSTRLHGAEAFTNALYCYGNDLLEPPGLSNRRFLFPINDTPADPLFDEEGFKQIRAGAQTITIRDEVHTISTDPAFYEAQGIELESPPSIFAFELLRGLLPELRPQLLATDLELRGQLTSELPVVLQLDEWRHPDVVNEEYPSQLESFQSIAEVLVRQDPARYRPSEPPNTHWRNWPYGGTL